MSRGLACFVGLFLVGFAAHGTVVASGGYYQPSAIITIALALGVAVGAAAIGAAARHGRMAIAIAIGLGLAAGEGYALLSTSQRVIASREAAQATMREANQRHANAVQRVAKAQEAMQAASEPKPLSSRHAAAQAAMDAAVAAIRDQAALPGCKENCRRLLISQAQDARSELEAAQAETTKAENSRRDSAQQELTEAQAHLAASPALSSPTPLADRLGVQPWLLDIIAAVLLSLGVNGLGAALIALAAHGNAQLPRLGIFAGWRNGDASQTANDNAPPMPGRVSKFAATYLQAAPSGRIEVGDVYKAYQNWCRASGLIPVDVTEFGDQLNEAIDVAGIRVVAHLDKVFLVGVVVKAA